jgi:glycosyltransferase involved in cell wall biosynthesis
MVSRLRVAWLINLYPPYVVGGNEMLAYDVVQALRERGHDIHVLTAHGQQLATQLNVHQVLNYDLDDVKDVLFQGARPLTWREHLRHYCFDMKTYWSVRRTVQELQPDLVVVDNMYQASAAPLLAVQKAQCPVVAQVADKWLIYLLRDLELLLRPHKPSLRLLVHAYTTVVQPLLWRWGRPDAVVTVSDFIKKFYEGYGFPAESVTPMHLGVDTVLYHPRVKPAGAVRELEVIFAGQLWEGKGPQVLIASLGQLHQRLPEMKLRLRIIGRGSADFEAYLREEVERWGIRDLTIFDGFLPLTELAQRLRKADIFVFPSIWEEPFSIILPAAMASGLPVIATESGGTPETFRDQVEGVLIPPNDSTALTEALLRLVRDPALRERLAQAAIRRVEGEWSFAAYVDRLEQHYLKLVAEEEGG